MKTKRKNELDKNDLAGIDPTQTKEDALRDLPDDDDTEEGPLAGPFLQSRRDARELVLKILYSHEITGESWRNLVNYYVPEAENRYYEFTVDLINRIQTGWEDIDVLIVDKAEKWDFNRIAIIDKLILRMSIAEILYFPDIPPKVTINEAIEIAKVYSTNNSSRFVNGILDAVYNDFKAEQKKKTPDS
ncbi:MAG: transcription antitermination factor NusB [FCB group bacterium]|nr:transcription antitermination factor NusB [FCB group bacterium]